MLKNRGEKNLDHRSLERMNLPKLVVSLLISRHKQIILLIPCLMMCAPLQIASTAHGDTLFQRIKLGFLHEIFSEFLTNSFQEFGIRKAILLCPSLLIIALHYLATIRKLLVHFANRFCAGIGTAQMVLITILSVLLRKTNEDIYHSFQKAPHVDGTRDNSCDNTTHISYLHKDDVRNLPC